MEHHDDIFRPALDETPWLAGPQSMTGRTVTWFFIIGSISHLLLGDAWQGEWLMANLIYCVGLAFLAWRGAAVGWALCAVGLLAPLLFMRDILTQSMILLFWSTAAAIGLGYDGLRRSDADEPVEDTGEWTMLTVFRGVTIATYVLAGFHKLNHDFLDPTYSCANYGMVELVEYWNVSPDVLPAWMVAAAPALVLIAELGIPALHLFGRRHLAWQLAVFFHIPLTLTMAPAFAFVMFAGHAAFATREDIERVRQMARWKFGLAAMLAVVCVAISKALHGDVPEWTLLLRHGWLWALGFGLLFAFPPWHRDVWAPQSKQPHSPSTKARYVAGVCVALFVINGLTPYLGIQYQHAGAMVSNLRIDEGCWNHALIPESVRVTDDYIRVEEVYFREPGQNREYEQIVEKQLWSPPQLRQMRRNWCHPSARPFYLEGTFRGRDFVIKDLCSNEPLPFGDAGMFDVEIFGDYLRFQKNLQRECPQACIH